ncbi:Peptidase S33 tripeptidyl aminopeptidase-lik [Cordyceps fumosorosea ARSEF 2679]|uniref:Peptidase S33 tripeptidyl aminopeptidase-lik n=1 Tax=Cordyceps fumosorosea (strain ARSEF 2679) TaxID=1081104 RepID=A0A167R5F8_CORFA|nr:Peptidase S33 tripeptidyl aminopeptidase-lik [Cordyceps fumosorosea ARSEF 2679]OAA58288.1 Peptidase S33 tripeptidyl aminopeptidase-lik [Cordyceps fumosorosea ARSEF 2679]
MADTSSSLVWGDCRDGYDLDVAPGATIQCARLSVQLDWSRPNGTTNSLAMARLPARDPARKLGSLVFNPGVPGSRAMSWMKMALALIRAASVPAHPSSATVASTTSASLFPQDAATVATLLSKSRRGYSYGSELGARYAELFPRRVGRVVLDGVVDHPSPRPRRSSACPSPTTRTCGASLHCAAATTRARCPGGTCSGFMKSWRRERTSISSLRRAATTGTCFANVTGEDFRNSVQNMLVFMDAQPSVAAHLPSWTKLGQALRRAMDAGDATAFAKGRIREGLSAAEASSHNSTDVDALQHKQRMLEAVAPLSRGGGEMWVWSSMCLGWPGRIPNLPRATSVGRDEVAPILLVDSMYDPECSLELAAGVQAQPPRSVLVTRLGDGHTRYMNGGDTSKAIDVFLVDGIMPEDGATYQP